MTSMKLIIIGQFFIVIALTSCKDNSSGNPILSGRDFDKGKWLLVVRNEAKNTKFIIDDKNVLKANPLGIRLGPNAYCGGTTCDGFIDLYKDGERIASEEFLSQSDLIESENIKKAYKAAISDCIEPSENEFKQKWDSLQTIKNTYPTRHHVQPQNKDIICFFRY